MILLAMVKKLKNNRHESLCLRESNNCSKSIQTTNRYLKWIVEISRKRLEVRWNQKIFKISYIYLFLLVIRSVFSPFLKENTDLIDSDFIKDKK